MMPTGNRPAGTAERPHPGTGGLTLDIAFERGDWPDPEALERLAEKAVMATLAATGANLPDEAELSVLFTDDPTMRALNARWRDKDRPTNVLSFPQDGGSLLGDIVLAFQTVRQEAALAHRPVEHHIAHLLIHGFLHILGYSHEDDEAADVMETLERTALAAIGIADPRRPGPFPDDA